MKITKGEPPKENNLIELGDVIILSDEEATFMVVKFTEPPSKQAPWGLVNLETGENFSIEYGTSTGNFNHPVHIHNHLKKHYGEYELIKKSRLELKIHPKP